MTSRLLCVMACLALALLPACGVGPRSVAKPKPTAEEIRELQRALARSEAPSLPRRTQPLVREWTVKETAADALARIGKAAIPQLMELLDEPNPTVRIHAARALGRMGSEAQPAVPKLVAALEDPEPEVQRAAARALGQMGPAASDAVPALIRVIKRPE
ncbi:MAG: HEAT repeat domain-containing protein [Pirellulales bacterium]|nr:HEAT repeat domain-containing protein [Pirellulales bacterium]